MGKIIIGGKDVNKPELDPEKHPWAFDDDFKGFLSGLVDEKLATRGDNEPPKNKDKAPTDKHPWFKKFGKQGDE